MSAAGIVQEWRRCVAKLLPRLHGHQSKALADFSYAAALAGHCQAGKLAGLAPTRARPASARRRFERLLANPRLRPRLVQRQLADALLAPWAGRTILLILDETPQANHLRAMTVRVAYAKRALPLAAVCYRPTAPPRRLPALVRGLLEQVHRSLPSPATVVLLADRGLCWPALVDWCRAHGWHYLLRLQGHTRVRGPDGTVRSVRDLVDRPGKRWLGQAEVFKKAGWRRANVVATWPRGVEEPWLLVTDRPASLRHCRAYGKRVWVEESFRDDKSSGFHWGHSRVRDPVHAERLLMVLAMAVVLAASVGTQATRAGWRRALDPHRRRRLSLIQIGLRWLRYVVAHDLLHLIRLGRLYFYPP
jgi:Transposase DDE domain